MPTIVGVRFRPVTKIYFFDPDSHKNFKIDDRVIVETVRGTELGTVAQPICNVSKKEIKGSLKKVVRRATPVDLIQAEEYRTKEPAAIKTCTEIAHQKNIPIKVLKADYSFDGTRLVFSFSAEQRVDFRDLVKDLTRSLDTRIEMKQIGARDETKMLDGYGRCGRRLCCSSWLTEFHPVSIKMAKTQGLPLAPAEISGVCGRLLCCLAYENDQYVEIRKTLPRVGSEVQISEGIFGSIRGLNVIKETVLIRTEEPGPYIELLATEVEVLKKGSRAAIIKKQKEQEGAGKSPNVNKILPDADKILPGVDDKPADDKSVNVENKPQRSSNRNRSRTRSNRAQGRDKRSHDEGKPVQEAGGKSPRSGKRNKRRGSKVQHTNKNLQDQNNKSQDGSKSKSKKSKGKNRNRW